MTNERGKSYEGRSPDGAAQPATSGERRVALVIGNAHYDHGKALANPHNDASAIAAMLSRLGFALHGGGNGWHADLGLIEMRRVLADFGIKAEGADMAVVYFAGHGMEVDGENYLLPRDCALDHVRRVRAETISLREVLSDVERARKLPLVILDACRVNEFAQRIRGLETTRSFRGGLADIDPPGDMLVAYAARHGLPALDGGDGATNSPYAKALLEHLETPDVDVRFLFGRVRDAVRAATKGAQIPHLYASLGGEPIYLSKTVIAAPAAATPDPDDRLWARIQGSRRVEDYQFYLEQFPVGRHAQIARFEIRRLTPSFDSSSATSSARNQQTDRARIQREPAKLTPEMQAKVDDMKRKLADKSNEVRRQVAEHTKTVILKAAEEGRAQGMAGAAAELSATKQFFDVVVGDGTNDRTVRLAPGESAPKDAPFASEMVLVPPGKFWMGSKDGEGHADERPRHEVTVGYPLLVGKYPVTFEEWDAFDRAGGMVQAKELTSGLIFKKTVTTREKYTPGDEGWGRGRRPVINVSWNDAKAYATWLSRATGKTYRLLTEAEWEYACRAGAETAYSIGDTISKEQAQFSSVRTVEVGSFPANGFGLFDMHGNVWEWCEDAWVANYSGAPIDGSARASGDTSVSRVLRGGSWGSTPLYLRAASRIRHLPVIRLSSFGFRMARTLEPTP